MRKCIFFLFGFVIFSSAIYSQKIAHGKFVTSMDYDKVFNSAFQVVSLDKNFRIKVFDKAQGMIQANWMENSQNNRELGNLVILFKKDSGNVTLNVTYSKYQFLIGGGKPEDWTRKLGEKIKQDIPDLTIDIIKD
jgi:hypothetical protein